MGMNVLIIEDELQTAWDLKQILLRIRPQAEIVGIVDSVETGKEWFAENAAPDVIFSDIQLGDGLVFEIFKDVPVTAPIIFCTAFDEYLLQAFKNNGIDYILKPIQDNEVEASLQKLENLQQPKPSAQLSLYELARDILGNNYKSTFIVPFREKLYPVEAANISLFKIADSITELYTSDGKRFSTSYTLEYLEKVLDPKKFYRANRQAIISHHAISEIEHYFERKLLVYLKSIKEPVLISKAKSSHFLGWLEEH